MEGSPGSSAPTNLNETQGGFQNLSQQELQAIADRNAQVASGHGDDGSYAQAQGQSNAQQANLLYLEAQRRGW